MNINFVFGMMLMGCAKENIRLFVYIPHTYMMHKYRQIKPNKGNPFTVPLFYIFQNIYGICCNAIYKMKSSVFMYEVNYWVIDDIVYTRSKRPISMAWYVGYSISVLFHVYIIRDGMILPCWRSGRNISDIKQIHTYANCIKFFVPSVIKSRGILFIWPYCVCTEVRKLPCGRFCVYLACAGARGFRNFAAKMKPIWQM